jgi:hypothetical protein
MIAARRGTFEVQATARPNLVVSAGGRGVVSHAGSRPLADLADRTTLTAELSGVLADLGRPRAVHDPGRVLVDLAVAWRTARGVSPISASWPISRVCSGPVASDSTVWRRLDQLGEPELAAVAAARAAAREVAWAQRTEASGAPVPASSAAGTELPELVIDVDASIVACHSEKEQAAATFKSSLRLSPDPGPSWITPGSSWPGCCGRVTPGRTPPPDHITVLNAALAQLPDSHRHGVPILIRADGAGCSKAFLTHIRGLREHGALTEFTVGWAVTDREREAISRLPAWAWTPAVDPEGRHRDGADVAGLTCLLLA